MACVFDLRATCPNENYLLRVRNGTTDTDNDEMVSRPERTPGPMTEYRRSIHSGKCPLVSLYEMMQSCSFFIDPAVMPISWKLWYFGVGGLAIETALGAAAGGPVGAGGAETVDAGPESTRL